MQVLETYGLEVIPVAKVLDAIVAALPRTKFEIAKPNDESEEI
jgi:DNA repair protein RadA/Sms